MRSQVVVNLLGRTDELELIEAVLAGRSPTGPCLLLRSEPGIGKTTLLDAGAASADAAGMRVLRASRVVPGHGPHRGRQRLRRGSPT